MLQKLTQSLIEDIAPLLPAGSAFDESTAINAFGKVWFDLVSRLPGEPLKSSQAVVTELRQGRYPSLFR